MRNNRIITATVFATALALCAPGAAQADNKKSERALAAQPIAPKIPAAQPAPAIPVVPCPTVDTRTAYIDTVTGLTLKATQGIKFTSPSAATLLGTGAKALSMSADTATAGLISFDTTTNIVTVESTTAVGTYLKTISAVVDSVTSTPYKMTVIVTAPVRPPFGGANACGQPSINLGGHEANEANEGREHEGSEAKRSPALAPNANATRVEVKSNQKSERRERR